MHNTFDVVASQASQACSSRINRLGESLISGSRPGNRSRSYQIILMSSRHFDARFREFFTNLQRGI
jgi:hypothetical protein